jgi:hypothetical protein
MNFVLVFHMGRFFSQFEPAVAFLLLILAQIVGPKFYGVHEKGCTLPI